MEDNTVTAVEPKEKTAQTGKAVKKDKKEKKPGFFKELKKEFYIPYAIDCMIKSGEAKTDVLSTPSHWFGVTYKEDRPAVVAKFQEFADNGVYPTPLYKK